MSWWRVSEKTSISISEITDNYWVQMLWYKRPLELPRHIFFLLPAIGYYNTVDTLACEHDATWHVIKNMVARLTVHITGYYGYRISPDCYYFLRLLLFSEIVIIL